MLAVLGVAVLALVGCSSDDGGTGSTGSTGAGTGTTTGAGAAQMFEISGDTTLDVAEGEAFVLALEANATTGYSWAEVVEGDAVRSDGGEYLAPEQGRPGQGGTQEFRYTAVAAGTAEIELTYSQVGSGDVGQQYTVTVQVS